MTRAFTAIGAGILTGSALILIAPAKPAAAQAATPAQAKPATAAAPDAEAPIRALLRDFTAHYNAAKLDELAAAFTDDAEIVSNDGSGTSGRAAITEHYKEAFAAGPVAQIQGTATKIRFFSPEVAQVEGEFAIHAGKPGEGEPLQTGRFAVIAVRGKDAKWRLAELRDDPDPAPEPASNYEKLQELEWMIGEWVDEGGEVKSTTTIKWAENKNFLVRAYKVQVGGEPASSGTQWIGWDPRSEQVRSWAFDSEGGFSEAVWTRLDDTRWVIKSSGTLRDGSTHSATQGIELINKDAARLSAVDRIVAGAAAPDIQEMVMVRRPPQPGAAPATTTKP